MCVQKVNIICQRFLETELLFALCDFVLNRNFLSRLFSALSMFREALRYKVLTVSCNYGRKSDFEKR